MPILTRKDMLKGYPENYPLNLVQERNLEVFLANLNDLQIICVNSGGKPFAITSGFRSEEHNKKVGGVKSSFHEIMAAADIQDDNGGLAHFVVNNIHFLEETELYLEHPMYTKGYVHLQMFPPRSGKRIFIPYTGDIKPGRYNSNFKDLKA